jgi:hypothetical protein
MGLTEGRRTVDNNCIINAAVDKYVRPNRERLYWCFVDFETAFD